MCYCEDLRLRELIPRCKYPPNPKTTKGTKRVTNRAAFRNWRPPTSPSACPLGEMPRKLARALRRDKLRVKFRSYANLAVGRNVCNLKSAKKREGSNVGSTAAF